ncbi:MAG: sigma-54-dependent Fis family transcriptional regulator [Deltaproteobacteria bacterium]|jgi:two-component system NtrC family response regulator|nr:sigma-54-dependent Fis family transcriptional regulator [Deltaproteobacteria bacterium]NTV56423.1 sigma-54-dependent Fis family transcriptional regulator [Deltaproteobacteria bacterium]
MDTLLIVDDEKNYLVVLEALLSPEGYEIMTSDKAQEALRLLQEADVDLVLTDMKMPGMSGMELLEEAKKIKPEVPVIMMTAYGTIEMAVEAMKKHAYDYITKPFQNEELKLTLRKALENYRLVKENRRLSEALSERHGYRNIVGKSKSMLKVYDLIDKVAQSKASVLITGPSGTGKELIAKAIHYESLRKDRPFISVNCGALAETLLESELFGHEKGAFTGAIAMKKGRFELADGGTLFLDEIGDMSPPLQVKLLRVLQEMEFERVGGTKTIKVDVRVLSASNRNLKDDVASGVFREDLFYRLNVIHIEVPPLRERMEDVRLLVTHFIEKYGDSKIELTPQAWEALYTHSWPGNIRELENVIERAVVLNSGNFIDLKDLPVEFTKAKGDLDVDRFIPPEAPLQSTLEEIEEKLIRRALKESGNVQSHAADQLGITKSLIQHKMKKYNISV